MNLLRYEIQSSPPIQAGPRQLIVQSRLFELKLPYNSFRWNRPVAVRVLEESGAEHVLPVVDITRLALNLMLGFTILAGILFLRRKS